MTTAPRDPSDAKPYKIVRLRTREPPLSPLQLPQTKQTRCAPTATPGPATHASTSAPADPYADRWGLPSPYATNPESTRAIAFDATRRNSQSAMAELSARGATLQTLLLILRCDRDGNSDDE